MREGNLSLRLTNIIGKDIINGTYPVNSELPTEAKFCEMFDVSRTVLREAFKMLSAKGLVSARPRRGTRVEPSENWQLFDPDILSWLQATRPSLHLLKEFTQLRQSIEPEAAVSAANVGSENKVKNIFIALEKMREAGEGVADPLDSDIEFHLAILKASENRFFQQLSGAVETALRFSILLTNRQKGVIAADYNDHKKVYDAIFEHRPDDARAAMKSMLDEVELFIDQLLEDKG